MSKQSIDDLSEQLVLTIRRSINEYDMTLAEVVGCLEVIKQELIQGQHLEYNENT